MKVRKLMKKLLDFNPDAEIDIVLYHKIFTEFSLGWNAPDSSKNVNSKMLTKQISIYIDNPTDNVK